MKASIPLMWLNYFLRIAIRALMSIFCSGVRSHPDLRKTVGRILYLELLGFSPVDGRAFPLEFGRSAVIVPPIKEFQ